MAASGSVFASAPVDGKLTLTINVRAFGLAGQHWKEQLTGRNRLKWRRIFIHGDPELAKLNRKFATEALKGVYRRQKIDIDECPGAMFVWDGPEFQAHDMAVDRFTNRSLGSSILAALKAEIPGQMAWYQVEFRFI